MKPRGGSGLTVIQAKLSSQEWSDEVIPNSQNSVMGCLAFHSLLLDAYIVSVNGIGVNWRMWALGPEGLVFPWHRSQSGSLLPHLPKPVPKRPAWPPFSKGSTLTPFEGLYDFKCSIANPGYRFPKSYNQVYLSGKQHFHCALKSP